VQGFLLALILLTTTAHAEVTWTDFSPKSAVVEKSQVVTDDTVVKPVTFKTEAEVKTDNNLDKEKYRVYFEDETLVLMVLGGIEYWHMNCGELTSTGEYFMALAIKKHGIDEEEMHMDMSFQTGLFAATLYNSCDHFLGQVKSIGLGMMFVETPQIMDITPAETIIN
jgi:hypothetical protein